MLVTNSPQLLRICTYLSVCLYVRFRRILRLECHFLSAQTTDAEKATQPVAYMRANSRRFLSAAISKADDSVVTLLSSFQVSDYDAGRV